MRASLADMVAAVELSVKRIRNALAVLIQESMIERDGSVITVTKYHQYQMRLSSPGKGENAPEEPGQGKGQGKGQGEPGKKGKVKKADKTALHKVKREGDGTTGARQKPEKGQKKGQGRGHAIYKDEEVSKKVSRRTTPLPPRKSGGRKSPASLDTDAALVLRLWRDAWAAAGVQRPEGLEGRNARQAADRIARDYLEPGILTEADLVDGMRRIVGLIQNDPNCGRYDLRTFATNPDKYILPPAAAPKVERERRFYWRVTCDRCGDESVTTPRPKSAGRPAPGPCPHCGGTMQAEVDGEWTG
ncbi:MAG: hypothetical protein LIP77_07110 [Planctomycetes bacterium]|nr:hypothetical protein [Planctomycetota bacterium]